MFTKEHLGLFWNRKRYIFGAFRSQENAFTKKFYFENVNFPAAKNVDFSIGNAIQNSSGINLTKITENDGLITEMSLLTNPSEKKKSKSVSMWKDFGFFGSEICEFNIEKVNMPENALFYVNQSYQSYKDNKKVFYKDIFTMAQITPLAYQPKDIESYKLNDDEVKILRSRTIQFLANFSELNIVLV